MKSPEDYKSLFDLNVPLEEDSFNRKTFKITMSLGKPITRSVELFCSEEINVMLFSYSNEDQDRIFVRIKNPLRGYDGYRADRYYPLSSAGESSTGDNRSFTINNFWAKYIQEILIATNGDLMYVDTISMHNNIFLKKEYDSNLIESELKFPFIKFPSVVRTVHTAYITKNTNRIIVPHYNACGKYDKQIHGIDPEGNVEQYSIISDKIYRDGGTTYTELADAKGIIHQYYKPTSFNPNLHAKFNEEPMYPITEPKELLTIIEKIGLITFPLRSN